MLSSETERENERVCICMTLLYSLVISNQDPNQSF
jgi:hypothetical protein